jgi:hypothetical protein
MNLAVLRIYGGAIAVCFVVVWVVSLAWWLLLPGARVIALDVPSGTAAAIARGEDVQVIPDTVALRRGDTLVIRNADDVVHQIGDEVLPPGRTTRIEVTRALLGTATLTCSIHPSGAIGVSTLARPGILSTAIPTALAGVPSSLALLVAIAIVRRLDDGVEAGPDDSQSTTLAA